jgi:hypothetical protein
VIEGFLRPRQRRAIRKLDCDEQVSLVLNRKKSGRHAGQSVECAGYDRQGNHREKSAAIDHPPDQAGIGVFEFCVNGIEPAIKDVALFLRDGPA